MKRERERGVCVCQERGMCDGQRVLPNAAVKRGDDQSFLPPDPCVCSPAAAATEPDTESAVSLWRRSEQLRCEITASTLRRGCVWFSNQKKTVFYRKLITAATILGFRQVFFRSSVPRGWFVLFLRLLATNVSISLSNLSNGAAWCLSGGCSCLTAKMSPVQRPVVLESHLERVYLDVCQIYSRKVDQPPKVSRKMTKN